VPVLIDLDVAAPAAAPRPRRDWRRVAGPAVAAVLLLLLGGAARPVGPPALPAVAGSGGQAVQVHLLGPDALFTARERPAGAQIEAAPLVAGGPRWSTPVLASLPSLELSGSTLVAVPRDTGRAAFLDARTGRVLWQAPPFAVVRVLGDRVAYWSWEQSIYEGRLQVADLRTGRTIWQRTADVMSLDGDETRLMAVDHGGQTTMFTLADGKVLTPPRAIGLVPEDWGADYNVRATAERIVGSTVYWWSSTDVSAYRLGDLGLIWRARVPAPTGLVTCGRLICVTGSGGVTALEPSTGAVRWSGPWHTITADGVAVATDGRAARLDLDTGYVVRELGRAGPVGDLLLRYDGQRTWAADLHDGRLLGVLPFVFPPACSAEGAFVACAVTGQSVTAWRVRA
jgi:hypothetical protein